VCCVIGTWGGRGPSMGGYVTVTGAKGGPTATGCRSCRLSSRRRVPVLRGPMVYSQIPAAENVWLSTVTSGSSRWSVFAESESSMESVRSFRSSMRALQQRAGVLAPRGSAPGCPVPVPTRREVT
jgi:hypothetical protein